MKTLFRKILGYLCGITLSVGCLFGLTACSHQHDFSSTYNKNEVYHWKVCTSGDNCDEIIEYDEHTFGQWTTKTPKTCTSKEVEHRVCVCGQEEIRDGESASHNPKQTLSYNETYHWNDCLDCTEVLNKQQHNFSEWTTAEPATCTTAEIQARVCGCGYTQTQTVGTPNHSPFETYSYDNTHHWKNCYNCTDQLSKEIHTMQDGICSTCKYGTVATIGDTAFTSIQQAVNSITDHTTPTTIVLFDTLEGAGVQVPSGSNIIFDLNGHTYTIVSPAVGSKGTTTGGFQLLKNSNITFKNGTITHATKYTVEQDDKDVQILIQNYSNLTLQNVTLDARSKMADAEGTCLYALSNNYGNIVIKENTNIIADQPRSPGYGGAAFDLWYTSTSYVTGVNVTFDSSFNGTVTGTIEYGANTKNTNWEALACLTISGGTFDTPEFILNAKVVNANIIIIGGTFNFDVGEYVPTGYKCELQNNKYVVTQE